jgi:hypothetical protein
MAVHPSIHTSPETHARIERASRWVQLDAPQRVNEHLLEFLDES